MQEGVTKEKEEQREGRNKSTIVNMSYINGGKYRKKFDLITDNKEINRLLYQCAKKMLEHRKGTKYEDMYWIDPNAEKIVASELGQTIEKEVHYTWKTRKTVKKYKKIGLITIHNHPDGFPPSIDDFNSNYKNNYSLGVVCGHNGKIFMYMSGAKIKSKSERYYLQKVAFFEKLGYNECEAQMKAIEVLSTMYNIKCKEVCL